MDNLRTLLQTAGGEVIFTILEKLQLKSSGVRCPFHLILVQAGQGNF